MENKKQKYDIPYDEEIRCSACGSVGINMLEEEDIIYGDKVTGTQKIVVCECGHIVKVLEDDEGDYE